MAATAAYVGSQGRNLFLRSIANQIIGVVTNPNPAQRRRSSSASSRSSRRGRRPATSTGVQNPYAEIDYKTSGGHDSYNALQLALTRRSANGLSLNAQYTLGRSKGNTGGSNEALTAGNNARDAEPTSTTTTATTTSTSATPSTSARSTTHRPRRQRARCDAARRLGRRRHRQRAQRPADRRAASTRPDIVYVDGAGNVFNNPAADRTAVINTPGGGASRNVRRPDLVPGVDPFIKDGGLLFLNPGGVRDAEAGHVRQPRAQLDPRTELQAGGPGRRQARSGSAAAPNVEFRVEIFNLFNTRELRRTRSARCRNALPSSGADRSEQGPAGTAVHRGGRRHLRPLTSTVGRTVGLGTNRQIQFAFRVNF